MTYSLGSLEIPLKHMTCQQGRMLRIICYRMMKSRWAATISSTRPVAINDMPVGASYTNTRDPLRSLTEAAGWLLESAES
jgi:hypothetical protein